jgi:hypothetical protein
MSLSGSVNLNALYVSHSASPGVAEFKSFQYTLLTRGEDIRRQPGVIIQDVLNNTPNTCSFTVDGGAPVPQVGEKIEIIDSFDSNRRLFAGTVQSVEQIYEGQVTNLAWRVQCIDFTWLFNRRRPFGQWTNASVTTVVKELIARYCPGFTDAYVQTNLAKVTVTLDGSKDMVTVMNELASAIGGGHWYVDYDQVVHFFHVVPPGLEVPIGPMPPSFAHMTVAQGSAIAQTFEYGYYLFRHSFIYSDGSESQLQCVSNILKCDGAHQLSFTGIPTGSNLGTVTCVGRRIYYNKFINGYPGGEAIEKIRGFCQINDNTTTAFTCNFGSQNASVATIAANAVFAQTYTATPGSLTPPLAGAGAAYVKLSDQAADRNLTGAISNGFYYDDPGIKTVDRFATRGWIGYNSAGVAYGEGATPSPRNSGDVYFASADVAAALENAVTNGQTAAPKIAFAGHLPGPATAPTGQVDTIRGSGYWNGGAFQFKTAFLYRDGSVSFPSPASATVTKRLIKGEGTAGYQLSNIIVGPTVDGNEVVARIVYYCQGPLANPNYSISWAGSGPADGYEWPIPFVEPNWAGGLVGGIAIIPDNTTTSLANFQLGDLDSSFNSGYTGVICGRGNVPYGNPNQAVLSVDPIPIWPNPDGPFLEDVDPPADIDDDNDDLLHEDSGSQPFTMTTDLSQIRNKVMVIGAGSVVTNTAERGASAIYVGDVSAFSPTGGTVKYDDPATGQVYKIRYIGVQGVPGNAAITLLSTLTQQVPQGANIVNYFEAEDHESQKFLSKIELDKNGLATDGIHEYTIVDTSLKATFQLFMRAYAELELFSKPIVTIRYATRDPKSRSGQTVHVELTSPPCVGDFLIQSVQIDQIHDESDQLLPRYTVTASSSKFDLNDLLLKIIGGDLNGGGGGNSSAGIAPAGAASAIPATGSTGLINPATGNRKWSTYASTFAGSTNNQNNGLASSWNTSGSSVTIDDVYPGVGGIAASWTRYIPVNNNGNLCGITSAAVAYWEYQPKFVARFRTGSQLFNMATPTNHRLYWIALVGGSGLTQGGDETSVTAPHVACMCKDPSNSQGSWEIQSVVSGASATVTRTRSNQGFAPMLPNTHYRITITTAITSATVLVEDLTRGLTYSASVNTPNYTSDQIPGTTNDKFAGQIYGSATVMAAEATAQAGGIDVGGGSYFESN